MGAPFIPLAVALAATLLVVAALGWACYRLLVDRGHLLLRLERLAPESSPRAPRGLPRDAFLSDFAWPTLDGRTLTLSGLVGSPLLLVVVQPDCLYSRAFARELARAPARSETPLPTLIVSGEVEAPESLAPFRGLPGHVLLDPGGQTARLLRISLTPAGYLVDAGRRVASPLLVGPAALLAAAAGDAPADQPILPPAVTPLSPGGSAPVPLTPGASAPEFTLPLATGGEWSLQAHHGQPRILLFSDPACPPCRALLAELPGWEQDSLVIVSRGDPAENRRLAESAGVTAPIVLQPGRDVARAYGMLQTPAAYAIDAAGTIVAGPATGGDEVRVLLHAARRRDREYHHAS